MTYLIGLLYYFSLAGSGWLTGSAIARKEPLEAIMGFSIMITLFILKHGA